MTLERAQNCFSPTARHSLASYLLQKWGIYMKTALCQLNISWENKKENRKKVLKFIEKAKREEADAIFFPETTLTGFTMDVGFMHDNKGEDLAFFREAAIKHQMIIGFGFIILTEKKGENHYGILDRQGNLVVDYVKIHSFILGKEDHYYQNGNEIMIGHIGGRSIAPLICFDLRFPDLFQAASQAADIIVVPANWPSARKKHWKLLLQARAVENQCYILGVNCVGDIGGIAYSGDSFIINPNGEILASLSNKEGLVIYDIPDDVEEYRRHFPMRPLPKKDF